MFKRNKIEVITPWSDEEFESEKAKYKYINRYVTRKEVAIASTVPIAASIGFAAHQYSLTDNLTTLTPLAVNAVPSGDLAVVPTGFIADKSLEMLATILDPVVQILIAISFPVASVIMIGACFFFMFGNTEKAWSMILNAGLGYVLINISPLFLDILRTVGEAVV